MVQNTIQIPAPVWQTLSRLGELAPLVFQMPEIGDGVEVVEILGRAPLEAHHDELVSSTSSNSDS